MTGGLYIHLPFCRAKCPYCDFYSLPFTEDAADRYTAALLRAIAGHPAADFTAETLYFGGGTPSLLGPRRLERLLNAAVERFAVPAKGEITMEANPGTVDGEALRAFRGIGINRLSLGVQSLEDRELKALGRIHSAAEAEEMINTAHQAGFGHLSADLMLGIPGQDEGSLTRTIHRLAALPLEHISAYLLKIEPDTPFARDCPDCADEDQAAALYLLCVEQLAALGFAQYEISNFARNGRVSRHNLNYWHCGQYLALGPGAHFFRNGRRGFFPRDLAAFLEADNPLTLAQDDGEGGGVEEWAMLRLRLTEGLPLAEAAGRGLDTESLRRKAAPLARQSLILLDDDRLALTPKGFLLSNAVTGAVLF